MRFIKLKMGIILCFILSHFRTFHPRHYTHARVQEVERKLHKRQDLNLRWNSEQRFVMIFPQNSILFFIGQLFKVRLASAIGLTTILICGFVYGKNDRFLQHFHWQKGISKNARGDYRVILIITSWVINTEEEYLILYT